MKERGSEREWWRKEGRGRWRGIVREVVRIEARGYGRKLEVERRRRKVQRERKRWIKVGEIERQRAIEENRKRESEKCTVVEEMWERER